jgi:hypothetical protein
LLLLCLPARAARLLLLLRTLLALRLRCLTLAARNN